MKLIIKASIQTLLIIPVLCIAAETVNMAPQIDQRSYRLGGVASFAEMVAVGVKKLALSAAMTPEEMDAMEGEIGRIAQAAGVLVYREKDLIVTDLFPADVATGKHVMLIYTGSTLDEYLALKQRRNQLASSGNYSTAARKEIAWQFGKLLSYPDAMLEKRLK